MKKFALLALTIALAAGSASAKAPSARGAIGRTTAATPSRSAAQPRLYATGYRANGKPIGITRLNPQPLPP